MSISIAAPVRECLAAFKSALASNMIGEEEKHRLNDAFGRFRIWAGNVSAHTSGRRLLEYRLRDSSELANGVATYLKRLQNTIIQGKAASPSRV